MRMRSIRLCTAASMLARCTPLRLGIFLCIALLAGLTVLGQARGMNSFHDAQFLSAYERHARITVTRFHEWPLWDPYNCGGLYGLAAPQTRYASPFFLLSLVFGVDPAASLLFVLLPALGMEGMFRYARRWGALALPAFLFAPLFPLCGWFAFAWHFGWVQFLSFCLVPWILYGLRGALRGERKGALLCAIAVAVTVGFGGTYTLPLALLLCACELFDAASPRFALSWRRPALYRRQARARARTLALGLLASVPLALGIAAYRLWPMLESVEATLRVMGGQPTQTFEALQKFLFVIAKQGVDDTGHFYVGPVVALGVLALPWRGHSALWLGAGVALALAFGHSSPHAPFVLLRKLPIYDTLRYPERYLLLFVLAASVLTARGASTAWALARRWGGSPFVVATLCMLIAAAVYGDVLESKNAKALASRVSLVPTPKVRDAPFRQSRGNRWLMSHFAAEGMGSLGCGEAYPLPMSTRLRGDLEAEEYLVAVTGGRAAPSGQARRRSWSPNRVVVDVDASSPVRLAINQNYHPGWHSSVGQVESWDGLLSVRLPSGHHEVVLRFLPRSGVGGMIASVVALLGGVLFVFRTPRSRLGRALAAGAGPVVVALLMLVWSEPPWRQPPPRTEDGEPVLLDAPPDDATTLHVQFEVPLALEAARFPSAPLRKGAGEAPIELFFRRTGPLSPSLGLFVHTFGPEGATGRADHPELSGRVYFAKMPLEKTVRDRFRVSLPLDAAGSWEVRFGLWNMYGDGARIRVKDRGRANVDNDAIVLGRLTFAAPQ